MQIEEIRELLAEMHEDRKGTMSLGISMAGATHTRKVDPLTVRQLNVTQRLQRDAGGKTSSLNATR